MAQRPKPSHSFFGSALFWGSTTTALLGCAAYITWQAVQQGDVFNQQAFETARQVHISIQTGDVIGRPPAVPLPAPVEAEAAPAAEAIPATPADAPAPGAHAEPDASAPVAAPAPAQPAPPATPEIPITSTRPVDPSIPVTSTTPVTPDTPITSTSHSAPVIQTQPQVPVQQTAPATPAMPAEPAAPATPADPSRPGAALSPTPAEAPKQAAETATPDAPTAAAIASTSGGGPLADAPAEGFVEQTPQGLLPVVASDGTKPWQYYARPFVRTQDRPAIALMLTGVGLNRQASELAAELPQNVSLSLSPYSADIGVWVKSLRTSGHEIFLDLPLEPVGYPAIDPGPDGLLTSLRPEQNIDNLKRIMGRTSGYVGMTIPPKERFTANKEAAYPVMQNINGRGLLFVLAVIPDKSVEELFKYNSFPYLTSDLLIDQDLTPELVNKQLAQLEDIARRQGYAIGTARALPNTLKQISAWSATLAQRNIELVPITAIAKTKYK